MKPLNYCRHLHSRINAAIINGKQGFGKVDKDYQLRPVKN